MVANAHTKKAPYTITALHWEGLAGRVLRMPATQAHYEHNEILAVHGQHTLLERWLGLLENFQEYGTVTMPDLPGFGGMGSFYTIGQKPTLDNFADYLAWFIKKQYGEKRIIVVGMSFGFVVFTRMLRRHPEMQTQIIILISAAGFSHYSDFRYERKKMRRYRTLSGVGGLPFISNVSREVFLSKPILRRVHRRMYEREVAQGLKPRLEAEAFEAMLTMEIDLWRKCDLRTQMYTTNEFLHLDHSDMQLDLPVWHIAIKGDHYFDPHVTESNMRRAFRDYRRSELDLQLHTPSVVATKEEAAVFVPADVRQMLANIF